MGGAARSPVMPPRNTNNNVSPSINIQPRREDGKLSISSRSNHSREASMSRDDNLSPLRGHLDTIKSEREPFLPDLPLIYRMGLENDREGLLGDDHKRKFHSTLCIDSRWERARGSISELKPKLATQRNKLSKSMEIDNFSIRYRNQSEIKTVLQKLQDTSRESLHKVQKYLNKRCRSKPFRPSSSRKSSTTSYTTVGINNNNLLNPERKTSESSCSSQTLENFAVLPTVPPTIPAPGGQPGAQIPVSPFPAKLPSKKVPDRQSIHSRPRLPTFVNSDFSSLPNDAQANNLSVSSRPTQIGNGYQNNYQGGGNYPNHPSKNPKLGHSNGPVLSFALETKATQNGTHDFLQPPSAKHLSPTSGQPGVPGGGGGLGSNSKKRQRPSLPKPPTNGVSDSTHQFNDLIEIHGMLLSKIF